MPKKIKFESFRYRFLIAAQQLHCAAAGAQPAWEEFLRGLDFRYERGRVLVSWTLANPGSAAFPLDEAHFHLRGDKEQYVLRQRELGLLRGEDPVKRENDAHFMGLVRSVAESAGYAVTSGATPALDGRLAKERAFHDAWANSEPVEEIDVRLVNEACTSPEMRYIRQRLGDIRGKRLLDVGCGLGEASVYFALLGAEVTSSDLSEGMLEATGRLARKNGVGVSPHVAAAEDLRLPADALFDIIYAGNLLHHVDIDQTLSRMVRHLAPNGVLVTWDPLAYNPVINAYRALATQVRTPDEHPLKWADIRLFRKYFDVVETRYFWLSTLIIFLIMALIQRRNPNRERYWKAVVLEGEKWRWLYAPLEKLDRLLLWLVPPLRPLCWNVVITASAPRR